MTQKLIELSASMVMMTKLKFDYSMKNIPVTNKGSYLFQMIEHIGMVIKRMLWKVIYCSVKENSIKTETYGLKNEKDPPPINELATFETNLIELVKNAKFLTVGNSSIQSGVLKYFSS